MYVCMYVCMYVYVYKYNLYLIVTFILFINMQLLECVYITHTCINTCT